MDLAAARARTTPERTAITCVASGREWSYGELHERAEHFVVLLAHAGVGVGDRVATLTYNRPETFALLFACARLGAILLPLNWRLSERELGHIIEDATPRTLVSDPAFDALASALASDMTRIRLGRADSTELVGPAHSGDPERVRFDPESVAVILYTSGTTGYPKGAMLPWRQLLENAYATTLSCDLHPRDSCLAFLPLFHTGGLNCLALPMLWRGGTVVLTERFDPDESLQVLQTHAITTVIAVPTMYAMLEDVGLLERPHALRLLLCGGAPCPHALLDRFHSAGLVFRQGYGLTEAGPNLFALSPLEGPHRLESVGRPALCGELALRDSNGNTIRAPDTVGELVVRGPHVMTGYFRRPEATAETLVDGWLHTGDLARFSSDGYGYIVGRKKEMFISGGENVYPAEIEQVLADHSGIIEAAVVGVPHDRWGQVGRAVVACRPDSGLDANTLRAWLRARLAAYKVPKEYRFVDALPRTSTGKIAKAALAAE